MTPASSTAPVDDRSVDLSAPHFSSVQTAVAMAKLLVLREADMDVTDRWGRSCRHLFSKLELRKRRGSLPALPQPP